MNSPSPTIESLAGEAWHAFPGNELIEREKATIATLTESGAEAVAKVLWGQAAVLHEAPAGQYQQLARWMDGVAVALSQGAAEEPRILRMNDAA